MRNAVRFTLCALAALTLATAQERVLAQSMTEADVKRLELSLTDARQDVARLKSRDARLAATLGKQLDQIAEEVTYLKVKMKKEGSVSRNEYVALRDRIDDLRTRAGAGTPTARASENAVTIPVGTLMDVRLQSSLSSGTAQVEDRFEATTVSDVTANNKVAVPAGALVRGVVAAVDKAGRTDRKGSLTLTFDQMTVGAKAYAIKATVTDKVEGSGKTEAAKVGGAAAAGAVIGAILGGGKGAAIGAILGGGGMVAATEGSDVEVPAGTVLRIRLDTAVTIQ